MKRTASSKVYYGFRTGLKNLKIILFLVFAVFLSLTPVFAQRAPIDINLIIDGSSSLTAVKNEVTTWVSGRLDQILAEGDRVTIWSAGTQSKVIYAGKIEGAPGREAVKKSIRDITPAGNTPDFSGALRDAASRQNSSFSYTLLISATPAALSSVLSTRQAGLLRFSRVEEFTNWRALVVGLNIDGKVKKSAAAYFAQ
jgi:hypothetical protein